MKELYCKDVGFDCPGVVQADSEYAAIVKAGGRFYLSGMSSKARGMTEADIAGKPAELNLPCPRY